MMSNSQTVDDERLLDEHEAARLLGMSHRTLQRYRVFGGGPAYLKVGGRLVRYQRKSLMAWATQDARNSTSQG